MTRIPPLVPSTAGHASQALVRGHLAGAAASAAFALAWLGLSWWHPALTYHFGPPLAAAAWPVLLRARLRHPARRGHALAAVSGGFLIAMARWASRWPRAGCAASPAEPAPGQWPPAPPEEPSR